MFQASTSSMNTFERGQKEASGQLPPRSSLKKSKVPNFCLQEETEQDEKAITPEEGIKIFFKALKKTTTKTAVEKALSDLGDLRYLRFPYSKAKKRNLGYGYVVFKDSAIASHLLSVVQKIEIDGRQIELQPYKEKDRKSNIEIKACHQAVKDYLREHSEEGFQIGPLRRTYDHEENPDDIGETAYSIRWNLHAIKPNKRLFFGVVASKMFTENIQDENVVYRIRKPQL